jgi:hypothetical protein
MERGDRSSLIAGILSLAGGAALIVAPFLRWISATVGGVGPGRIRRPGIAPGFPRTGQGVPPFARSLSVQGIDLSVGKVALLAGIVLVAAGFVLWLSSSAAARTAMGIVGLVASTAAASVVLYRMGGLVDGGVLARLQVTASRSIGAGMVVAVLGSLAGVAGCIVALAMAPKVTSHPGPLPGSSDLPVAPAPPSPTAPEAGVAGPIEPAPAPTEPVEVPPDLPSGEAPAREDAPASPTPAGR